MRRPVRKPGASPPSPTDCWRELLAFGFARSYGVRGASVARSSALLSNRDALTHLQVRRMVNVADDVPEELRPAASAALAWINEERGAAFKVTGVVDADAALAAPADAAVEFGLVLCEDEMCLREQVRVERQDGRFQVSAVQAAPSLIPPLLDPPRGVRRDWLARQLDKHEFAVLLVYRGLW